MNTAAAFSICIVHHSKARNRDLNRPWIIFTCNCLAFDNSKKKNLSIIEIVLPFNHLDVMLFGCFAGKSNIVTLIQATNEEKED